MTNFSQLMLYLINFAGTAYCAIALLRFLAQLSGADYYNPLTQFVVKATQPAVAPLRKVIPPRKALDLAALLWAVIASLLFIEGTSLIFTGGMIALHTAAIWALLGLANLALNIFFYGLILIIVLSWVAPHTNHPGVRFVGQIVGPVMRPFQQLIPPIGGLDLSPIFAFLVINVLQHFVVREFAVQMRLIPQLVPGF